MRLNIRLEPYTAWESYGRPWMWLQGGNGRSFEARHVHYCLQTFTNDEVLTNVNYRTITTSINDSLVLRIMQMPEGLQSLSPSHSANNWAVEGEGTRGACLCNSVHASVFMSRDTGSWHRVRRRRCQHTVKLETFRDGFLSMSWTCFSLLI